MHANYLNFGLCYSFVRISTSMLYLLAGNKTTFFEDMFLIIDATQYVQYIANVISVIRRFSDTL